MMKNDSLDNYLSKEEYEKVNVFFLNELKLPIPKFGIGRWKVFQTPNAQTPNAFHLG